MSIKLTVLTLCIAGFIWMDIQNVAAVDGNGATLAHKQRILENIPEASEFLDKKQPFYFIAEGISLHDLMTGFSNNYRVKVSVSNKIDVLINRTFEAISARQFLDEICSLYNLTWYFDSTVLYITAISENTSSMLTLHNISTEKLEQAVKDSGIWDNRFQWRKMPEQSIVYVSGPPRYVSVINDTVKIVDAQKAMLEEKNLDVAIIRLKHIPISDELVQLLRKMFISDKSVLYSGNISTEEKQEKNQARDLAKKQGTNATGFKGIIDIAAANHPPINAAIESIAQLNAILVRDTPQRINMYRFLIRELDKPQRQVEINLSIIDIRVSKSDDLGILWDINKSANPDSNLGIVLKTDFGAGGVSSGNPFTLIGKNTSDFISRVSILHREGNARYASRPAILTQDNSEASLDFTNTLHIPLSSKYSNSIQTISFGTQLKITPRIIDFANKKQVSLKIDISDGKTGGGGETDLPVVNNVTIKTMATINEGESLLIGGYYTDSTIERANKLPFLSELPIIGLLFKDLTNKKVRYMRMFLLQPRIISNTDDHSSIIYAARDKILRQIKENRDTDLDYSEYSESSDLVSDDPASLDLNKIKEKATKPVADENSNNVVTEPQKLTDAIKDNKQQHHEIATSDKATENHYSSNFYLANLQNMYADFSSVFPCYNKSDAKKLIKNLHKKNQKFSEADCITDSGIAGIRIIMDDIE